MTEDSSTNKNIIGLLSINKDSRRIVHVQYILIMIRTRKLFTHNKEKKKNKRKHIQDKIPRYITNHIMIMIINTYRTN